MFVSNNTLLFLLNILALSFLKDFIFLDNKVPRFAFRAVLAHLKIVENHALSQEVEGAQNCLCRKVGHFVEAWVEGGWSNKRVESLCVRYIYRAHRGGGLPPPTAPRFASTTAGLGASLLRRGRR